MRKEANALYVQSSEVEERPAPKCFALESVAGTWIFQTPYREPQVNDSRAWWPSQETSAEWEGTVPINLPLQLFIDGELICMTARANHALELREVDVRAQGTI